MSKKVYIVTAGEYSDYHIEAVFLDRVLAERYVDVLTREERYPEHRRVEEYDIGTSVGKRVPVHYVGWVEKVWIPDCDNWSLTINWEWEHEAPKRPRVIELPFRGHMIRASCTDKALAEKAVRDRVAKYRAEKAGIADR